MCRPCSLPVGKIRLDLRTENGADDDVFERTDMGSCWLKARRTFAKATLRDQRCTHAFSRMIMYAMETQLREIHRSTAYFLSLARFRPRDGCENDLRIVFPASSCRAIRYILQFPHTNNLTPRISLFLKLSPVDWRIFCICSRFRVFAVEQCDLPNRILKTHLCRKPPLLRVQ